MLDFQPGHLHFEISSFCNAACQLCPRYQRNDDGYWLNPLINQTNLDPAIIKALLDHPLSSEVRVILFCGDYGDPLFHPDIVDLVSHVNGIPRIEQLHIHSNAGLRSTDTWSRLGTLMQKANFKMFFSLDGLEDTNHIYRRNVRWDKVMRNAKAFIAAGGQAVWKMILFDHNRHQVETARALAKDMGFVDFWLQENDGGYPVDAELRLIKRPQEITGKRHTKQSLLIANEAQRRDAPVITCEHHLDRSIYVSASGRLWPCCWLADGDEHPDDVLRNLTKLFLEEPYGEGWNDTNRHGLDEIYASPMWAQLQRDIADRTGIYRCSHVCGRTRDQIRATPLGFDANNGMHARK